MVQLQFMLQWHRNSDALAFYQENLYSYYISYLKFASIYKGNKARV